MGRKAVFCLLYFLAVVFTGLLLAAAVLSWRASFVSPEQGGFWATIALLLPVVLLANLAALVWWLIRRRWIVALMPLAALLLNMGYVSSMIQLPDFNAPAGSHDIRIATLNVNGFRQLGPKSITAAAVAEMMRHEQVDVLCLQEFLDDGEFPADSIGALFSRRMPYFVSEGSGAVASRYPILDCKYVRFPDTSNDYLRADLDGKPRPIHTWHGERTLAYERTTSWVRNNIVQQPRTVREGDGWAEKIVGEHDLLYFTLRRLEFEKRIEDDTCGKFHVLTLVDGERIRIRSVAQPERYFDAEYMDMVVVPADMGRYVIENLRTEPICVHKTMLKDGFDKE